MMREWGADVVGMTSVPEVVLAKELGLCYASVGFVVNMASGMGMWSNSIGFNWGNAGPEQRKSKSNVSGYLYKNTGSAKLRMLRLNCAFVEFF